MAYVAFHVVTASSLLLTFSFTVVPNSTSILFFLSSSLALFDVPIVSSTYPHATTCTTLHAHIGNYSSIIPAQRQKNVLHKHVFL